MWVVDTCILIDVLEGDPSFGDASAKCLRAHLRHGLTLAPVSYVELALAFNGSVLLQEEFLRGVGLELEAFGSRQELLMAHSAWYGYFQLKRQKKVPKRPIADILIGAFAQIHEGLITRNGDDFRPFFPRLKIVTPR